MKVLIIEENITSLRDYNGPKSDVQLADVVISNGRVLKNRYGTKFVADKKTAYMFSDIDDYAENGFVGLVLNERDRIIWSMARLRIGRALDDG